jgi:prepilin-type N-terminal cleavage/methylation domain-containing protein
MGERVLEEESGFTLPEMMVTMMVMLVVMFALYSIFDMSLRVFSFGNDKVEAVENARLGLEKMEREIRAAYPYDKASGNTTLFPGSYASKTHGITFGNDLDGSRKIECLSPGTCEVITYDVYQPAGSTADALGRKLGSGDRQPVVEYVEDVTGDGEALTFEYLDRFGAPAVTEAQAAMVRIELEVAIDRGSQGKRTQVLTTDVALRNRIN